MEVLKEDAKLQILLQIAKQKIEDAVDELHRCIQELEHKNALQERDIQIKELELQVSRRNEESTNRETEPTYISRPVHVSGLSDWVEVAAVEDQTKGTQNWSSEDSNDESVRLEDSTESIKTRGLY